MSQPIAFDVETSRRVEAMYTTPDAVRRRAEAMRALAPRPGEHALDIGCGPGFLTQELATAVGPGGRVAAIDSSDAMLALARRRCASRSQVTIQSGDAARLDFPDASFDLAASVQVHEYVRDVEGSLKDLYRVLRPGGRALIVATDWDSIVWSSADDARMTRVLSAFEEHLAHLHLPRRLRPLLAGAGLRVERCEAFVQLNPTSDPNTFSFGLMELIRRFVPGRRGVSGAEADAWAEELRARAGRDEYFFSLNQYFFLASKP